MTNISDMTDREILVKHDADLCWLRKSMSNHIQHHWAITLACMTAALMCAGALVASLIISVYSR